MIAPFGMAQLLVRDIEPAVVRKLRSRAAAQGVSVEEAHRRLLRSALVGGETGPKKSFIDYLRSIPPDDSIELPPPPLSTNSPS
jgi:plasmid stability protein